MRITLVVHGTMAFGYKATDERIMWTTQENPRTTK